MDLFDGVGGGVGDLGGIETCGNGAGAVCEVEGTGGGKDRKRAGREFWAGRKWKVGGADIIVGWD